MQGDVKPEDPSNPEEFLKNMRERFHKDMEGDRENRQKAIADIKFCDVPGEQWDLELKAERGKRPCYEFNKLRITMKRVVNDMRANRPSAKVRGTEDDDKDLADIYEGIIRNIWNVSDGDTIIDGAAEYQVKGGMGAWRVDTELPDDEVANQNIVLKAIPNPMCVYADRFCQDPMKRDARHWFITNVMSPDTFEGKYGKAKKDSFDSADFDRTNWQTEDGIRVCEYWYKVPVKKLLILTPDNKVLAQEDYTPEEWAALYATKVRERIVDAFRIEMCVCSATDILEGPTPWAGPNFPFVVVYGEYIIIDGKIYWFGLTRFSKDAQRAYNVSRTTIMETIALAPQAKWWSTPAKAKGLQDSWAEAHRKNLPVMYYNPDPKDPGPPTRMGGADVPAALIQEAAMGSEDIKATSGIFDNSLGQQANETSGVAIRARNAQGEIATFNYMDNMVKGVRRTWEIIIGMVPHILDSERIMRMLGRDGSEKFARINQPALDPNGQPIMDPKTGKPLVLNDLSVGKFDVTVTAGPSFATQRQEAAETYGDMIQKNPQLTPIIGDLVMKASDLPYSDEMAERMKRALPPQFQDQPTPDGKPLPPVAQQALDQANAQMAAASQLHHQLQEAAAQIQEGQSNLNQQMADLKVQSAELSAERAEMNSQYEQQLAKLAQKEAALTIKEAQAGAGLDDQARSQQHEQERSDLAQMVTDGMQGITAMAQQYMERVAAMLTQIQAANQPQIVVNNPPKSRVVRMKRVNGELVGQVDDIPSEVAIQ